MLFALDFSSTARKIRSITSCADHESLMPLVEMLRSKARSLPYSYLEEILSRTTTRLKSEKDSSMQTVLDELYRSSLWTIQRIHMEHRGRV